MHGPGAALLSVPLSFLLPVQILALAPLLVSLASSWAVAAAVAPRAQLLSLPLLWLPCVLSSRDVPCHRALTCELHVYNLLLLMKATGCRDFIKLAPFPLPSVRYTIRALMW